MITLYIVIGIVAFLLLGLYLSILYWSIQREDECARHAEERRRRQKETVWEEWGP